MLLIHLDYYYYYYFTDKNISFILYLFYMLDFHVGFLTSFAIIS